MIKGTNRRIMITLTEKETEELDKICERRGVTRSYVIKDALRDYTYRMGDFYDRYDRREKERESAQPCKEIGAQG